MTSQDQSVQVAGRRELQSSTESARDDVLMGTALRLGLTAALVVLAERLCHLGAVLWWLRRIGAPVSTVYDRNDGTSYLRIAESGYAPPPPLTADGVYSQTTDLAFFPGYSLLVRAVDVVLPGGVFAAAEVVTLIAAGVAAAGIAIFIGRRLGFRCGVVGGALWGLLPSAAALSIPRSEALFVACCVWSLLQLDRGRLVSAALLCAGAGIVRPAGAAVLLAVWLAVYRDKTAATRTRLVAVAIAPLGLVVALGHVWRATGRIDGWLWLQRTVWNSGFDFGRSAAKATRDTWLTTTPVLPYIVAALTVLVFAVLLLAFDWSRPRWHVAVYVLVIVGLAFGGRNYLESKPRFLLPAFPLLEAPARAIAGWRLRTLVGALLAMLLMSSVWNAWLLVAWPFAF